MSTFSDWGNDPSKNKRVRRKLGKDGGHGNFLTYAYRAQVALGWGKRPDGKR